MGHFVGSVNLWPRDNLATEGMYLVAYCLRYQVSLKKKPSSSYCQVIQKILPHRQPILQPHTEYE